MSMTASLEQLAPSFTGQLLQSTDAGYDEAKAGFAAGARLTAQRWLELDPLNPVSRKVLHGIAQADGTVVLLTAQTVASL